MSEVFPLGADSQAHVFYQQSTKVAFRRVGDDVLLVPIRTDAREPLGIYTLNKTAAVLWMLLEAKHTLTEMAEALVARFAVDWEQAYRDATAFCEDLLSFGAVEELITGSSTA